MKKLIDKVHLLFFMVVPILLVVGLISRDSLLDINVHDTFYVISHRHLTLLFSVIFGVIGLGYWSVYKLKGRLTKWMTLTHIILTFGGILLTAITSFVLNTFYSSTNLEDIDGMLTANLILWMLISLVLFGQIIFPINLFSAFKNKMKNKRG